jgi:hypothetical protein
MQEYLEICNMDQAWHGTSYRLKGHYTFCVNVSRHKTNNTNYIIKNKF